MDPKRVLILATLNASEDGIVEGRTRLQKLIFLAQKSNEGVPEVFQFEPYDYGPFSAPILHDLDSLREDGYVVEETEQIRNGKKYIYQLTEDGKEALDEADEADSDEVDIKELIDAAQSAVSKYNKMPISRLLEYTYNKYPEYTKKSVL